MKSPLEMIVIYIIIRCVCADSVRVEIATLSTSKPNTAVSNTPSGLVAWQNITPPCKSLTKARPWPSARDVAVATSLRSALVLRSRLLAGAYAKPCKSLTKSAQALFSPQHVMQKPPFGGFCFVLRGRDLHPRPPGYEPGELLLLHPAIGADCTTSQFYSQ